MAALPYMQLYVADYLADTAHLTTLENGAYLLLLFNYWQRGEPFTANDERTLNERLARVVRMSNDEWETVRANVAEFFVTTPGSWSHERMDRDLEAVKSKSSKAAEAGKASAEARKKKDLEHPLNDGSTNAKRTVNDPDPDPDKDPDLKDTKIGVSDETPSAGSGEPAETPKAVRIPYEAIQDLYHSELPSHPRHRMMTDLRKTQIKSAWTRYPALQSMAGWQRFFVYVREENPFLNGLVPGYDGRPPFVADLDWLTNKSNLQKIFDRRYDQNRNNAASESNG